MQRLVIIDLLEFRQRNWLLQYSGSRPITTADNMLQLAQHMMSQGQRDGVPQKPSAVALATLHM